MKTGNDTLAVWEFMRRYNKGAGCDPYNSAPAIVLRDGWGLKWL